MKSKGVRILIIDDEIQIRRFLRIALDGHGYEIAEAVCGKDGLNYVTMHRPDLVILDLGLPDMDGLEVLKELREWSKVPVIVLSVRKQEDEKIAALDSGADDYLTKPFGMGELLARIRAAMRHLSGIGEEPVIEFGNLIIDLSRRRVTVDSRDIKLSPIEYDLIKNLALHGGKVLTHKYLLRTVWGPSYENENHYLQVYIGQLRRKIEHDPSHPLHIITEPGIGYRLL